MSPEQPKQPRQIHEIKCACRACGNVWFYGKQEIAANELARKHNLAAASMQAATCCNPAVGCLGTVTPRKPMIDLDKCPKCGSGAVVKETVIHDL